MQRNKERERESTAVGRMISIFFDIPRLAVGILISGNYFRRVVEAWERKALQQGCRGWTRNKGKKRGPTFE